VALTSTRFLPTHPWLRVWRGHENRKRAGVRFCPQIVEVDGEPKAKFSNTPGHKNVWRSACHDVVSLWDSRISEGKKMLEPVLDHGYR